MIHEWHSAIVNDPVKLKVLLGRSASNLWARWCKDRGLTVYSRTWHMAGSVQKSIFSAKFSINRAYKLLQYFGFSIIIETKNFDIAVLFADNDVQSIGVSGKIITIDSRDGGVGRRQNRRQRPTDPAAFQNRQTNQIVDPIAAQPLTMLPQAMNILSCTVPKAPPSLTISILVPGKVLNTIWNGEENLQTKLQ
uniref:LAGLIDADG homing endonuclease n=1 Tax=Romanomermis culicivorax TaxID=13658 RepID=A0A915ID67_ROMCU